MHISWQAVGKILRGLWVTFGLIALIWLFLSFQAKGVDPRLLQDDEQVTVVNDSETLRFLPTAQPQSVGLLFYPGGMVEPTAYAPLAHALAKRGYATIIVKLPWRTAMFPGQEENLGAHTRALIQENDAVTQWVLGGHSRGAALAVRFAHAATDTLAGLILIGTSHPKEAAWSLANSNLNVLKIYASQDGLASVAEVEANRSFLPATTQWVLIEGGNHAQFGYYGSQLGDNQATLSREEQQAQMLAAIQHFLSTVP
ncbi:MAG: hypothetical protein KF832_02095 [Caldilineaceae bacterium]|nr:hypothetical protein [Caldilineaceae bacterium]